MNKVAVITGCSTGLGISIATLLAKQDHPVYATMRNMDKQSELQRACDDSNVEVGIKQRDDEYRPILDKYIDGARTRAADREHMQ